MSDHDRTEATQAATVPLPEARARHTRWPGLVWALPLAALIIVAFLGLRALAERGIEVVVTFETAAGARVKDTKVIYQGVEAGEVTRIEINPDGRRVDMTLLLDPRAEPALTSEAKFWLIGAKPNLGDISSVKAALAGLTIGVAPGHGGTPTRRFEGLEEPPLVMPGTPGTSYVLTSSALGTAQVGSSLFYRGQHAGLVTAVHFAAQDKFRLEVFVNAPYDQLIRPAAMFWIASPVQVSLTDKGASASLEHADALFKGAIEIDLPGAGRDGAQSPAGASFPLYQGRREAQDGPSGPEVPYAFRFKGPAGELVEGAPVRLLGFQVGTVKSLRLDIDPATGAVSTSVVAVLYPKKMHVAGPAGTQEPAAWREATDAVVAQLVAQGFRARLQQSPPLIGARIISLDPVPGAKPAVLPAASAPGAARLITSVDSGGSIDEMIGQVNQLLAKFNRVPLDAIAQDVQQLTAKINGLVGSPQLAHSLEHLNRTLAQADAMMGEVAPQVGPLVRKLDRAVDQANETVAAARGLLGGEPSAGASPDATLPVAIEELAQTARSIRELSDYLSRHPEALIRGRGSDAAEDRKKESR